MDFMATISYVITYTSINIDPNGRTPPNMTMAHGSMNLVKTN